MGKYLNDSLKISVNAVETKSLISGRTNGKPGRHILFMKKSAVFSVRKRRVLIFKKNFIIFSRINKKKVHFNDDSSNHFNPEIQCNSFESLAFDMRASSFDQNAH